MYRTALLLSLAALTGCTTVQERRTAEVDSLLTALLAEPIAADSAFREGSEVSFQVNRATPLGPAGVTSAQIQASCVAPSASMMYLDGNKRVYLGANGKAEYRKPYSLAERLYPSLKQNADFLRLCGELDQPDWRRIKGSGDEQWVLLDLNSIKNQNGVTKFWAAYDNRLIALDLPYSAPYAQKREHYAVDCNQQTYRLLAGYDLDEKNQVTDGRVDAAPMSEPMAGSNEDYVVLFQAVCKAPASLAQLPAHTPRAKEPLPIILPEVTGPVLGAINRLNMPAATKSLSYIEEVGTNTMKGKTSALRTETYLSEDKASGQLAIRNVGESYEGREVSFRGLLKLTQKTDFGSMKETTALNSLSFTGDWQQMPVGSQLTFSSQGKTVNSLVGEYGKDLKVRTCTVKRDLAASELNTTLSGSAKELTCSLNGDEYKRVDTLYYLRDYAYFYWASTEKNAFYYHDTRLHTVK